MLANSSLGNLVHMDSSRNQYNTIQFLDIPSVLEFKQNCMNLENLNFYGCMVKCINSNPKAIYRYIHIWLGIWRYDGPGRHRMLTVINAYYGYYGILLIHLYSFNIRC